MRRFQPSICLFIIISALFLWVDLGQAQDPEPPEEEDEIFGFDDIEEEAPPATHAVASWVDNIHISGRFDLNFEMENPLEDKTARTGRFRNYHKFLFLKVTPNDKVTLDAEVLDLSYYEIRYNFYEEFDFQFGKIWVPFGATPFHHYYGGIQGDPFHGLLLPNVWSEYGAAIHGPLLTRDLISVEGDVFVMKGFDGKLGTVLPLSNGGSDDTFAIGGRTKLAVGTKIATWGSVLYNRFGADGEGQLLLWGADLMLDYGVLDIPVLRDLRIRAAFARAEIQDEVLVDRRNNPDGWYFRYGDYAELTYRGVPLVTPRVRYGTIIDFDDRISSNDSHSWELALLGRINPNISILGQYQFNLEEVNEVDNDLFRVQAVFEF